MLKRLMMIYPPVNSYRACQIEAWIRSFHTFPRLTLPLAIFRSSLAVSIYWRVSICIHVPSCILSSHCGAVHQFPEVFGIDEFGDVTCHGATKNPDFSGLLGLRDVGRGQLGKPSGPGIISAWPKNEATWRMNHGKSWKIHRLFHRAHILRWFPRPCVITSSGTPTENYHHQKIQHLTFDGKPLHLVERTTGFL